MLTTAGDADRFATNLVRRLELAFLRFVFGVVMSSPRWLGKRDVTVPWLPMGIPPMTSDVSTFQTLARLVDNRHPHNGSTSAMA
jgi:hypothetical protein